MIDPTTTLTLAVAALIGLAMLVFAGLRGWHDWLELRHHELGSAPVPPGAGAGAGARIEIADLRERIRKLEAIAAGVEL